MSEKKVYKGVYLVKFLMAILVVVCYTAPWRLMGLVDAAFPFFFIAAGFFLFRKTEGKSRKETSSVIGRWIGKVLGAYALWTLIYLPFTVYGYIGEGLGWTDALLRFGRNFLFVGENLWSGPLWYLLALVWAGVLVWLMARMRFPVWLMLLVGAALAVSTYWIDYESMGWYAKVFSVTRNGFFVGLLYLATGGLLQRLHVEGSAVLYALGAAGCFAGLQFTHWCLYPLTVFLFLLSTRIQPKGMDRHLAKMIGEVGDSVYLIHMLFAGLIVLVTDLPMPSAPLFLLTVSLAVGTAAAWQQFRDRAV